MPVPRAIRRDHGGQFRRSANGGSREGPPFVRPGARRGRPVAADGRRWVVREQLVRPRDGRPVHDVPTFETRFVLRWLRDFPHDWRRLSDRDLERLSWRR